MNRLLPLALALLLLLSACAAPSEIPSVTTGGETNPPAGTSEHPDVDPGHELPPFTDPCDTMEKYRRFVSSHRLPENFVSYEAVSSFGNFRGLVCSDSMKSYDYALTDAAGNYVGIAVVHFPYANLDQYEYSRGSNEDMRRIEDKSEKWTYLSIGPACYHYYGGNLIMLYVRMQEGEIRIETDDGLQSYTTKDTALSRLLTRSTAEAEAKALLAKIEG